MEELEIEEIKCNIYNTFHEFQSIEIKSNKNETLNCMALNVRGLRKNWNTLIATLHQILHRIHILILIETNITEYEIDLYRISEYNSIHYCRESRTGGGILIFVKNHINVKVIPHNFTVAESVIVQLNCCDVTQTIAVVYRPPSNNIRIFNQQLEEWLNTPNIKNNKNLTLIGDINLDIQDQNRQRHNATVADEYINILNTMGLQIGIREATREEIYGDHMTSSCIDHVNTRIRPAMIETFLIKSKIADHYFIGFKMTMRKGTGIHDTRKNKINIISDRIASNLIDRKNWNQYLHTQEPNILYNTIVQDFNKIYEQATITIVENRKRNCHPWFNNEIKQNIIKKENLWNQIKRSPNDSSIKTEYKKQRNYVTNLIRKEKRNYYYNKINSHIGDGRKTWDIINEILNAKKKSINTTIKEHFKLEDSELPSMCDKFNNIFNKRVEEMNENITDIEYDITANLCNANDRTTNTSLHLQKIKPDTLEKIVSNLNIRASPGPDNIKPSHIKNNFQRLKTILLHFYNLIIETRTIPTNMKITLLKPIYKSGTKTDLSNYRPIGAISILLKIFEYVIHKSLMDYCINNGILNDNQFGFVPNKSTTKLLEKVAYSINTSIDKRKIVLAALLDLSKAFDTIQHSIMIEKLRKIGIGGKLLDIFKDYFKDRKTVVRIGKSDSQSKNQKYGIIQGHLYPHCFLTFT
jgi:hypothetical protein